MARSLPSSSPSRAPARRRRVGAALVLGALGVALFPTAAAPAGADAATDAAVGFLVAEQRADGGFGPAEPGFAGFETPDAVLAIASHAQTGGAWDPSAARAAVESVANGGRSGLGYLDDWADGDLGDFGPGSAARVVIVASALGLDPDAFDPDGDGATDLVTTMTDGLLPDGSFGAGTLNTTLEVMIAYAAAGLPVPAATVAYVRAAQQANGSWGYSGDPSGDDVDPDTTGLALQALVAAGLDADDDAVSAAVALLATAQLADGSWGEAFGNESNPSSTAFATLGLVAVGHDPTRSCWRDRAVPDLVGAPYTSPDDALRATQAADGHLASPFDEFGVNTVGTSQGLVALERTYLPVVRGEVECTVAASSTTTTSTPATTTTTPSDVSAVAEPGSDVGVEAATSSELPRTGAPAARLVAVAVAMLTAGVAAGAAARRRSREVVR